MSYSRYFRMATPMLTGRASTAMRATLPMARATVPGLLVSGTAIRPPATATTDPPTSHLSWSRRSPDERR